MTEEQLMLQRIKSIDGPYEQSIEVRRHDIREWTKILEKARAEGDLFMEARAEKNIERYREDIAGLKQRGAKQ